MNAEKISRAMQYVNDALLMEYLQMDDKLTAEKYIILGSGQVR